MYIYPKYWQMLCYYDQMACQKDYRRVAARRKSHTRVAFRQT